MSPASTILRRGDRSPAVARLQSDLAELGFKLAGIADGAFGPKTELAVREFQIYARFPTVARERPLPATSSYAARLEQAPNREPYGGHISGEADGATLQAVAYWKRERLRCPVVVEAWTMRGDVRQGDAPLAENIWFHDELRDHNPRIFVRDFSAYYPLVGGRTRDEPIVIGEYLDRVGGGGPHSRPPYHTWPECEVTPQALLGEDLAAALRHPARTSTFKVMRAVSEAECRGYLDSVNCWDNVFASLGPFHWAMGAVEWDNGGELGGFLAYLRAAYPDAYERGWGFFGVRPVRDWGADGAALFSSSTHRYSCRLALQGAGGVYETVPLDAARMNYFRTWHMFYRHLMAVRTSPDVRRAMWDMARMRIRDVLATPCGGGFHVTLPGGGQRPATIGDICTSERLVAAIVRWHIRYPAHMIRYGQAGAVLLAAIERVAQQARGKDVSTWNSEELLIAALRAAPEAPDTLEGVLEWPRWGRNPRNYRLDSTALGALSTRPGSFQLDATGLPPAPR
jgi:hypothetical protein